MATKKNNKSGFFLGAVFGAIAGGIAGVLTAPKSGAATRNEIEKKGKQIIKDIEGNTKKAGTAAKKTATTAKKAVKAGVKAAKAEAKKK